VGHFVGAGHAYPFCGRLHGSCFSFGRVCLFSFDIVTNLLISPCIFLLIAYIKPPACRARNELAALDHNAHCGRAVMTNKDGTIRSISLV
jgi:hypothetical protein